MGQGRSKTGFALRAGLCSVTLRGRTVAEVVELAAAAGLSTIEWGGDVHVPPGDLIAADEAARRTVDAGLEVASYGSYLSANAKASRYVDAVLDTTVALGTPLVRVWCPGGVEPGADPTVRGEVTASVAAIAGAADERGLAVYLEFHGGTLTASVSSALELLDDVDAPSLYCAWQPPYWDDQPVAADLADLKAIGTRLGPVHVYEWEADGTRHPLARGTDVWRSRLATIAAIVSSGAADSPDCVDSADPVDSVHASSVALPTRSALLEFVLDDDPAALAADAATLRAWLADVTSPHQP